MEYTRTRTFLALTTANKIAYCVVAGTCSSTTEVLATQDFLSQPVGHYNRRPDVPATVNHPVVCLLMGAPHTKQPWLPLRRSPKSPLCSSNGPGNNSSSTRSTKMRILGKYFAHTPLIGFSSNTLPLSTPVSNRRIRQKTRRCSDE